MAETPQTKPSTNTPVGHLSVHIEGAHPTDVPFQFERVQKRTFGAMAASAVINVAAILLVVLLAIEGHHDLNADSYVKPFVPPNVVWTVQPGPGGGGGGGGNQMKEPPRKVDLPSVDKLKTPVPKPQPVDPPKEITNPLPVPQIAQLDAKAMAADTPLNGVFDGVPNATSQGSGTGGGGGTGTGTGMGPGQGPGIGPGWGGGIGGGAYRPGNGVSEPKVVKVVKPAYTAEAMRAKITGSVWVECVVLPDGTVADAHVTRSLDRTFGLDQEAIKAALQWRFIPGMRNGQPVAVLISIQLDFNLV